MDGTLAQPLDRPRQSRPWWVGGALGVAGGVIGLLSGALLMLCLCSTALWIYVLYWQGNLGATDGLITTGGGTIAHGEQVSGEMLSLDQAHNWEFEGEAGQRIEITVTGYGSDPYIRLIGPEGNVIAQNDDAGGTLNAYILTTLPSTGSYTIRVSVLTPGRYTLNLDE